MWTFCFGLKREGYIYLSIYNYNYIYLKIELRKERGIRDKRMGWKMKEGEGCVKERRGEEFKAGCKLENEKGMLLMKQLYENEKECDCYEKDGEGGGVKPRCLGEDCIDEGYERYLGMWEERLGGRDMVMAGGETERMEWIRDKDDEEYRAMERQLDFGGSRSVIKKMMDAGRDRLGSVCARRWYAVRKAIDMIRRLMDEEEEAESEAARAEIAFDVCRIKNEYVDWDDVGRSSSSGTRSEEEEESSSSSEEEESSSSEEEEESSSDEEGEGKKKKTYRRLQRSKGKKKRSTTRTSWKEERSATTTITTNKSKGTTTSRYLKEEEGKSTASDVKGKKSVKALDMAGRRQAMEERRRMAHREQQQMFSQMRRAEERVEVEREYVHKMNEVLRAGLRSETKKMMEKMRKLKEHIEAYGGEEKIVECNGEEGKEWLRKMKAKGERSMEKIRKEGKAQFERSSRRLRVEFCTAYRSRMGNCVGMQDGVERYDAIVKDLLAGYDDDELRAEVMKDEGWSSLKSAWDASVDYGKEEEAAILKKVAEVEEEDEEETGEEEEDESSDEEDDEDDDGMEVDEYRLKREVDSGEEGGDDDDEEDKAEIRALKRKLKNGGREDGELGTQNYDAMFEAMIKQQDQQRRKVRRMR